MKRTSEKGIHTRNVVKAMIALAGGIAWCLIGNMLLKRYSLWSSQSKFDQVKAFPPAEKCRIQVLVYASEDNFSFTYQMEDNAEKEKLLEALSKLEYDGYYGFFSDQPDEPGRYYSVSIYSVEEDYHAWLTIGAYPSEFSDKTVRVKYGNAEPALNYLDEILGAGEGVVSPLP